MDYVETWQLEILEIQVNGILSKSSIIFSKKFFSEHMEFRIHLIMVASKPSLPMK